MLDGVDVGGSTATALRGARHTRAGLIAAILVGCFAMLAPPAAAAAAPRTYVAEFKGTYTYSADWTTRDSFLHDAASLSFDAKLYSAYAPGATTPTSSTGTFVAQGTIDGRGTNGANVDTIHCTYRQAPQSRAADIVVVAPNGAGASLGRLINGGLAGSCSGQGDSSFGLGQCGSSGCTGVCEENYAPTQIGDFESFGRASEPVVNGYPRRGSRSYRLNGSVGATGACFGGTQSVALTIQGTLTLGGGPPGSVGPPAPRSLTPAEKQAKNDALAVFKTTWEKAVYPCAVAAATFPLVGLTATYALIIVPVITGTSGAICATYVSTMIDAANTFKDPPLRGYERVARVVRPQATGVRPPRSCRGLTGAVRAFCGRLNAAAPAVARASDSVSAVMRAMEITISRETGARRARDRAAAARQDRALARLDVQLHAAIRTERAADRALAGLLRAARVSLVVPAPQSAAAVTGLESRLASRGLSATRIGSIDRSLLVPGPGDWLRALRAG